MLIDRRAVLTGMAAAPLLAATGGGAPITIFEARSIVTMEPGLPTARYMAVADGMILGLADSPDLLAAWTAHRQHKLDRRFADKVLFPGLIDPHIHPMQSAVMLALPFLAPDEWHLPSGHWPGISGQDAYRAQLRKLVEQDPSEPLITWGHHELFHGPLDKAVLDEIAPERALFVWQRSFHEIIANSAALASIGLADKAAFDAAMMAGKVETGHGDFGRGIFAETALLVALAKLRPTLLAPDRMRSGFAGLHRLMQQRGVTTTSDMATGIFAPFDAEAGLIAGSFGNAETSARVMLMPTASELDHVTDIDDWFSAKRLRFTSNGVLLDRRVKLLADGAFFAQNMRMGPPGYTDGHIGKWITPPADLRRQTDRYWKAGLSLHIHVNGDEGTEEVLGAIASLPLRRAQSITLEHLGYCTEAQARRIADLGLMVSAQPNYIRVLGEAYGRHGLGVDRAAHMNRLGTLARRGVPIGLHSDFNMAPIDPFYLAWIAETREGIDGKVRAPEERLSREKALRAITVEAAQVIGLDSIIGSLAAGKKADFIALDADPRLVEVDQLKQLPISATVFEGKVSS